MSRSVFDVLPIFMKANLDEINDGYGFTNRSFISDLESLLSLLPSAMLKAANICSSENFYTKQ